MYWYTSTNQRGSSLRIWKSLVGQWFLVALAIVVLVGTVASPQLSFLADQSWLRESVVFFVMALMALPVPLAWVRRALRQPWPAILASLINMGLFPLVALAFAMLMTPYVGGGLIVAATIPCTLASAAVWTNKAGGDDTVAVLVTLITNLACVVVTPLWLVLLLGKRVQLDLGDLIQGLLVVVLLPMTLAQIARLKQSVAQWATKNKQSIALICQFGILTMVLLGSIQMGQRIRFSSDAHALTIQQVIEVTVLASLLHLLVLGIGWWLAAQTRIARPQKIAVAIGGSQKTLMVGLKLAIDCGVSILPMVVYHISQLVLDTILADRWRAHGQTLDKQSEPSRTP